MALSVLPTCYLSFDEGTGTSAADSAGAHTGTLNLGLGWTTGKRGTCPNFTGGGGYASIATGGGLNNLQTGSISVWVRWDGTQDEADAGIYGPVSSRTVMSVPHLIIGLNGADPDTAKIVVGLYGTTIAVTSATSPGDGVWRHIILEYASGAQTLYLDSVADGTGTATGTIADSAGIDLYLGVLDVEPGDMIGLIDEFCVAPGLWNEADRTLLYGGGSPPSYEALLAEPVQVNISNGSTVNVVLTTRPV